jgi:hypothetical protein
MFAYPHKHDPMIVHSSLEKQFIADCLARVGCRVEDLKSMPADRAKELKTAACQYASLKLAEFESRSRFMDKIHSEEKIPGIDC